MKYVLSQEEYDDLKSRKKEHIKLEHKKLQELCTKIADTMPVSGWWNRTDGIPTPWGMYP